LDQTAKQLKLKIDQLERKQQKIEQLLMEKMPNSIFSLLKSDGKIVSREFSSVSKSMLVSRVCYLF
jgi:hypothetical protein